MPFFVNHFVTFILEGAILINLYLLYLMSVYIIYISTPVIYLFKCILKIVESE